MQNNSDDNDKVMYHWAYNLPCALLVNGRNKFWFDHIKTIYEMLRKETAMNLRVSLACSFKELISILEIDKMN
jgi:hypothetical protein